MPALMYFYGKAEYMKRPVWGIENHGDLRDV